MIHTIVYDKRWVAAGVALLAAIGIVTMLLSAHLLTIDHFDGVSGFSIGTNNYYCSVEDKLPVFTCEHAL